MSEPTADVGTFDAQVLPAPPVTKWDREYAAFLRLLPELLKTYRGAYVAVHEGRVVGHGPDQIAVADAAYREFGPVEILVRLVTDAPPRVVRIPSVWRCGPEAV